jgi:hypothetical protein
MTGGDQLKSIAELSGKACSSKSILILAPARVEIFENRICAAQ